MPLTKRTFIPALILPGLLVAATGVGAGDLATAGFAGSKLGAAVLWAVVLGAFLKFVLTEGLARWQLATDQTLLEGVVTRLGPIASIVFLLYLLPWSFVVGAALISACGVTMQAMVPIVEDPAVGKLIWGVIQSAIGVMIVWIGGFRWFERVMSVTIAVMFISVIASAALMRPDLGEIARGLFTPTIPDFSGQGLIWTIALMGGVGGTLTVLCYGYWIREKGRAGAAAIRACRIDLAVAYVMTGLFGMAMLVIARGLELDGTGAGLIVNLAGQLEGQIGPSGRWIFLIGAWAAVFSSLLGVWQAVPYIFADFCRVCRRSSESHAAGRSSVVNTSAWTYRGFLLGLAIIPLVQVGRKFDEVQKVYAVIGAAFIPLLAIVLLVLNGRRAWVGEHRNRPLTVAVLIATLLLSVLAGYFEVRKKIFPPPPESPASVTMG